METVPARQGWSTPPRAVAFDFDGVLLESHGIKTEAFRRLYADRPDQLEAILRLHEQNLGVSRFRKFRWIHDQLLAEPLSEAELQELGRRFSELVLEAVVDCPVVPGAIDSLRRLQRAGIPCFVASGTPQEELRMLAERRGLASYFLGIHGSPTGKRDILLSILDRLSIEPPELTMIGDGRSDYDAAQAVSARFVLRETPEQAPYFEGIDVPRLPDLMALPALLNLGREPAGPPGDAA